VNISRCSSPPSNTFHGDGLPRRTSYDARSSPAIPEEGPAALREYTPCTAVPPGVDVPAGRRANAAAQGVPARARRHARLHADARASDGPESRWKLPRRHRGSLPAVSVHGDGGGQDGVGVGRYSGVHQNFKYRPPGVFLAIGSDIHGYDYMQIAACREALPPSSSFHVPLPLPGHCAVPSSLVGSGVR